jgi:predicted ATPase
MIRKVHIQNFKSLADFDMELGRVNVIVGANGSGKTNILEGIAMGAAAAANKLDHEFLGARIRVTEPEFMRSGFGGLKEDLEIAIDTELDYANRSFMLQEDEGQWYDRGLLRSFKSNMLAISLLNRYADHPKIAHLEDDGWRTLTRMTQDYLSKSKNGSELPPEKLEELLEHLTDARFEDERMSKFLIYSPENTFLRKFEEPAQLYPLGIRGEGLFHELKRIFTDKKKQKQQAEIKEHLQLLDWFEDFEIPNGLMSMEYKISIKDRFLDPKLAAFDQRSANEGFLMLLFYLVLFTSENTPLFFAIENIESAFNPRMCWELMQLLAKLAKKHNKQFIVTTHNSSTLNGLDLRDDEQRLFVASRNSKGHTRVQRITQKPEKGVMLSEIWTKGYIGGMPDNF